MTGPATTRVKVGAGESLIADLATTTLQGPSGVIWGLDSPQLNVNFVTIKPGDEMGEHVNAEVDVMLIVVSGTGELTIDGIVTAVGPDFVALVPRDTTRSISSTSGMAYYSIHARRSGLAVGERP